MYNGIGISTARGTGTNGYVQKNLSFVPQKRERVEYVKDVEIKKLEKLIEKKGNSEILEHEKKRRIEVKCIEMRDMMLNNGYDEETTNQKVDKFRKVLVEREGLYDKTDIEYDEFGRPLAKETHQLAQANDEKNRKLREAFGIGEYDRKKITEQKGAEAKEAERRKAEVANRQYTIVRDDEEEEQPPPPPRRTRDLTPEKQEEVAEPSKKDKEKKKDKEDRHRHKSRDEKKRKSSPETTKERSSHKHSKKHRHERDRSDDEEESRHRRRRQRSSSN